MTLAVGPEDLTIDFIGVAPGNYYVQFTLQSTGYPVFNDAALACRQIFDCKAILWAPDLNEYFLRTGKTAEQIARDTERDYYLSAEDAKSYGLVDRVASRRADVQLGGSDAGTAERSKPIAAPAGG